MVSVAEKKISLFVEQQFPAIYREEKGGLVDLVKEYYIFLETAENQAIYNSRRLFEYRDIDNTLEDMLIFFKKKYLADLPFNEVRFITKHIMDLYRRKGTQEGIELFFRIFYEENAKIYYPSKNILKPSDSKWEKGTYLEMFPNTNTFRSTQNDIIYNYDDIMGRTIVGEASRATAIVDNINFVTINKKTIPIIFINKISGEFFKNEGIYSEVNGVPVNFGQIRGSLSEVIIKNKSSDILNNNVGDVVTFRTPEGVNGTGFITKVTETFTGFVVYEYPEGGWGYTIDSTRLLTSNQILFIRETDQEGTPITIPFRLKETERVEDQLGNTGRLIGRSDFAIGIKSDPGSDFQKEILSGDPDNPPQVGSIVQSPTREPLERFVFAPLSVIDNYKTISESLLTDPNFTSVAIGPNRWLGDINGDGLVDETDFFILQSYLRGEPIKDRAIYDYITKDFHQFLKDNSGTYSQYYAYKYELVSVVEKNESSPGPLYPDTGNENHVIAAPLENTQEIPLIFDLIEDFKDVPLNSLNYNTVPPAVKPMTGTADPVTINTPLNQAFDLTPVELGSITYFENTDQGFDYVNDVFSLAEDERMIRFGRNNQFITLVNIPASINIGDAITQGIVAGKVVNIIDKTLEVLPYAYYGFNKRDPIRYAGKSWPILGISTNYNSKTYGLNAVVDSTVEFGVGRIKEVKVVDSGYNYIEGKYKDVNEADVEVLLTSGEVGAVGVVKISGEGNTGGYWSSLDSHLNGYVIDKSKETPLTSYYDSGKRIQDSDYYQEFSYEIQSKIDINTYEKSLKDLVHLSGTKVFGKFNYEDITKVSLDASRIYIEDLVIPKADEGVVIDPVIQDPVTPPANPVLGGNPNYGVWATQGAWTLTPGQILPENTNVTNVITIPNAIPGTTVEVTASGTIDVNDFSPSSTFYSGLTQTLTIDANGAVTVTIALLPDSKTEGNETLILTLAEFDSNLFPTGSPSQLWYVGDTSTSTEEVASDASSILITADNSNATADITF